jgi:hypothetical protein
MRNASVVYTACRAKKKKVLSFPFTFLKKISELQQQALQFSKSIKAHVPT